MPLNIDKKAKEISTAFFIMILASLAVIIPLTVFNNLLLVFIFYYLAICLVVPLIDLLVVKRRPINECLQFLGFTDENKKRAIVFGILHGMAILGFTTGGFFVFRDFFMSGDIATTLRSWGVGDEAKLLIFLLMVLFNGMIEEVFWRGYLYEKFGDYFSRWFIIIVVSLFYMSYHLATVLRFFSLSFMSILMVLFIFIAGLFWGWMRYYFKNIWASVLGHTLATVGYMVVYLLV